MWLENVINWQISKNKKIWNLEVSKPENKNFRLKNAIKIQFKISRKKEHSFFADTKLQVDQIKKKRRKSSVSHYLFKNQLLLKVETIINFQVKN